MNDLLELIRENPKLTTALAAVVTAAWAILAGLIGAVWKIYVHVKPVDGQTHDQDLQIPERGPYGLNLLADKIETAIVGRDYSLTAVAPSDHKIRVRTEGAFPEENRGWGIPSSGFEGWVRTAGDASEHVHEFSLPAGQRGDLKVNCRSEGTQRIELYTRDQGSSERVIEFDWKQ